MKNKAVAVVVALVGLAVVVFGVAQVFRGIEEMNGGAMPTVAEARKVAEEAAGNLTRFASTSRGVSLQYPKDWTVEEPAAGPVFFKCKTWKGVVNLSAVSEDVPSGTDLAAYVEQNVHGVQSALSAQNMAPQVLGRSNMQVGQEAAVRLLYSYTMVEQKLDIEITQVFVLHGARAYAFTLTTPKDLHAEFDGLVAKILTSVQFT